MPPRRIQLRYRMPILPEGFHHYCRSSPSPSQTHKSYLQNSNPASPVFASPDASDYHGEHERASPESGDTRTQLSPNNSNYDTPYARSPDIASHLSFEVDTPQSKPSRTSAQDKICLGSIVLSASSITLEDLPAGEELSLTAIGSSVQLWAGRSAAKQRYIGLLKSPTSSIFKDIVDGCAIDPNIYFLEREPTGSDVSMGFQVIADLYCFEDQRVKIGRFLLRNNLYLSDPHLNKRRLKYSNPHILVVSDSDVIQRLREEGIDFSTSNDKTEHKAKKLSIIELKDRENEISDLFTTGSHQIPDFNDLNLQVSEKINIELKPHQTLGVCWMLDKEGYPHRPGRYLRSRGGILADEMGMGKTLTTLALVATTNDLMPQKSHVINAIPTTLIICPKSGKQYNIPTHEFVGPAGFFATCSSLLDMALVITGWEEQINRFTQIKYLVYEPAGRKLVKPCFEEYDLVITTYGAIANSRSRTTKDLSEFHWRRIILDEAHTIRERSTKQAKAIFALESEYRWCLTGTPVQNKLDDYGALLEFIQHETTKCRSLFHSNIIKPLRQKNENSLRRLQELVAETTLRRLKANSQLGLPQRQDTLHKLVFNQEEERLHRLLGKFVSAKINQAIREGTLKNTGFYAAQLILRLRQVCNHGISLLPQSLQEELRNFSTQGDEEFAISNTFMKMICELCKSSETDAKNTRTYEDCQHTVCLKCNMSATDCPLCLNSNSEDISMAMEPSTKVQNLISNLQSGPGRKSVVFSCWTKMLDLVEVALRRNKIGFTRMEGSLTTKERRERLRIFRSDPNCRVFLSTLGSGSTGLDLTTASEVHLLEPQFNPMLEEQALARVHRIGQTQAVTTIRYVMKDSYEEVSFTRKY
ncbi:hypothetical protein TWF718_007699 [Orbilia javanica]|uniref:Uncharacterized protein n=1 Tax=Orbilia javanica TaxID=47235 RepID=A0AAN8RGM5_9PEZI